MSTKLISLIIVIINCYLHCCVHCLPTTDHPHQSDPKVVNKSSKIKGNKVILILADGVRYDYTNDPNLKGFHGMARNGVKAEYVTPIFPANSYPNWYTIVTGKYSETHGMVQNFMFDPEKNDTFLMSPHPNASHAHWWEMAEPLWITAEKQGIKTAVYWWDGCQVEIKNTTPSLCIEYQSFWTWPTIKNDTVDAIDEILDNFKSDEWGLALIYYEAVDASGHAWGPDSEQRLEALKELDDLLLYINDQVNERNMSELVNTIVVSDHGMLNVDVDEGTNNTKVIEIESILDEKDVIVMLDRGGTSMLIPLNGREKKVLEDLKKANTTGLLYYDKPNIPVKYHFKNNVRVAPILLVAKKGYFLKGFSSYGKTKPVSDVLYPGHHGYDPYDVKEMRTIMYASGPGLKKDYISKPLMMTDHYNLICHLLNIDAQPNNGSWLRVQDMVADSSNLPIDLEICKSSVSSQIKSPSTESIVILILTLIISTTVLIY